jgi:signal transduction histidine kinase/ActR/RegA family two-component response regulator
MSRIDLCRRFLLGLALSWASAAVADGPVVNIDSGKDFADVTAALMFQSATSEATAPDPSRFRPVSADTAVFERYDGSYWFELELANGSAEPVRRLLELTHGRLGLMVARLRTADTERELERIGAGVPASTRAVSFPNAVIPIDLAPMSRATLLIYATSRDNMVLSARLWSESGFSAYQLRHELIVGAGLGALFVLGIYNLVVFLITRGPNYARLSALLISIAFWQVIGHGYADLVLWPDSPWLTERTLTGLMPLCLLALIAFGSGFLDIDSTSRTGRAMRIYQMLCAAAAPLLFCWPKSQFFIPLTLLLTPSAVWLLGFAVVAMRAGDANARRFVVATSPLIVTMAVAAAARIVGSAFEVGTVQSLVMLSSVFLSVMLAIALAQHIQVLSSDRRDAHHAALVAKLRAKESELKADLAEQDNRAKTSFLATMSHEIRTPMNGILGMADLLRGTSLDEQQSYYIATLKRSGEALMNILNDVLDYSKAEAGRMELEVVTVDLLELLDDINVLYREHFRRKSLDFYVFVEQGTPFWFRSDSTRLKQIVGNLVNNAVKFTDRGQVTIVVRPHPNKNDQIEFLIRDTGIGIAPEHARHLFDRFRQADSSISRRYGGTGLGLAISKRLIELLGGEIDVTTDPGVGTTFRFSISAPPADGVRQVRVDHATRVFLVSDDAELARSIGLVMSRWVGQFIVLEDLDELAAHAPTERDCVILDETCVEPNTDIDAANVAWIGEGFDSGNAIARPVLFAQLERLLRPAVQHPASKSEQRPLEDLGVLVAEDNRTNRLVVGKMLNNWGATVHFAENGQEAIEMFGNHSKDIDVVLMDCEMPEMDGYSATRHIRTLERSGRRATTPIIALTAHAMPEFRRRAEEAGMTDYVTKPIQKSTLLKAMLNARAKADPGTAAQMRR